ncbi:hypothetical protein FF38_02305 [Lucilia cuprina]|uniref:Uncharacterized protein n=1 Tax=Lucilia cuprina TaxID=7375 RepID=A0A0L0C6E7_LUCCU|nr:hypothetical protein FF38_02305 [Lucilia cuprina]
MFLPLAEQGFDPRTSGLWAQHASTAPLCFSRTEQGFDPRTSGLWAQHASTAPLCFWESLDRKASLVTRSERWLERRANNAKLSWLERRANNAKLSWLERRANNAKLSWLERRANNAKVAGSIPSWAIDLFEKEYQEKSNLAHEGIEPATFALLARRSNQLS